MPLNRKALFVNLTDKKAESQEISMELRKKFLGGRGLNMYYLYKLTEKGMDPFSPENPFIVGAGLLTGMFYGRINISSIAPESGGYLGDSNMGGYFGAELAATNYSHLIIRGKSDKPVYLFIDNDRVEFRDASNLWGKDAVETQKIIKEELGDKNIRVMTIGQAGENLVRFACVMTGLKNAAGRTGMGAVMGSKNLKAIAVRGRTPFKLANPKQYLEDLRETNKKANGTGWGKALGVLGTPLLLKNANRKGFTSYKYHQYTNVTDPAIEELYAESLNEKYAKGMASCFGCPIHCRHRYEVTDGVGKGTKGEGPKYATIAAFGPTVGNLNLSSVLKLNDLCNRYGIDTISGGDYLGYFFKLYQEGIITEKDVGYPLEWGNHEAIEKLLTDIALKRGFGEIAGEGSFAWKKLPNSNEARKELLAIKNVSIEMTDERPVIAFAFGLAVATRGTCHMRSRASIDVVPYPRDLLAEFYGGDVGKDFKDYTGKGRMVWWHEIFNAVVDSIGLCRFASIFSSISSIGYLDISKLLKTALNMEISEKELAVSGERIYTLERMYINREGISRKDDYLPDLYFDEPIPSGPTKGIRVSREKFERLLDEYYEIHGWDKNGVVPQETMEKLGLTKLG